MPGATKGGAGRSSCSGVPALVLVGVRPACPRGASGPVRDEGRARPGDRHPAHPMSVESAFSRLKQVRTVHMAVLAFAAIGFGLFTSPILQSLYVEDEFGLDALERGLLGSLGGLFIVAILPFAARGYDARFREDPAKALRLVGFLILPVAVVGAHPVLDAQRAVVRLRRGGAAGAPDDGVHDGLPDPAVGRPLPVARHGLRAGAIYMFFIGATGGALIAVLPRGRHRPQAVGAAPDGAEHARRGLLLLRGRC